MQTLTPELAEILKSSFQAAARGFRARCRMQYHVPVVSGTVPTNVALGKTVTGSTFSGGPIPTYREVLFSSPGSATNGNLSDWTRTASYTGDGAWHYNAWWDIDLAADYDVSSLRMYLVQGTGGGNALPYLGAEGSVALQWLGQLYYSDDASTWTMVPIADITQTTTGTGESIWRVWTLNTSLTHRYWRVMATYSTAGVGYNYVNYMGFAEVEVYGVPTTTVIDENTVTIDLPRPRTVNIDKSLTTVADQAEVAFANEGLPLGWAPDGPLVTNARLLIDQWYGDEDDVGGAIRTFTGLIDRYTYSRDLLAVTVSARDMMALALDQSFSSTAPQTAGETGAVRTEANGVYLNREISYIVNDMLDRMGWPPADRDVADTSFVLDEFIVSDGSTWAAAIIGDTQLTGLVGYSCWADEFGVFHFRPTYVSQNLTDPVPPAYTFRSGEDVMSLSDETDQSTLRTRVKARGPLTTSTLEDTWRELWRTNKIQYPVGLWYAPSEPTILRVLDRGTKRLYRLRQSDRVVLGSVYLGGVIPYPLGLSGDPSDASIYWVLNAPWKFGGGTGGNSVKKVRKSDNAVLATYSIPSGMWSAIKVSATGVWLTNLSTDRFYKRSKTTMAAIADYRHTYGSLQSNPSGMMIDGTTLHVFWANGGTTARFLICSESAPGTVTKVIKTTGTTLHGGEMDTTTHTECYGDSDSLHLVAKFTLHIKEEQTKEVWAEVADGDLEDELGYNAVVEERLHDVHPTFLAHRFEVRRDTLDLKVVTSLAQATDAARRRLEIISQRARVVDVGIIGNPVLQKTDPVAVYDPVTSLSSGFVIDTYRSTMDAEGTYVGTLALIPVFPLDDEPTDDGTASDPFTIIQSAENESVNTTGDVTVTLPDTPGTGDLLVAWIEVRGIGSSITTPSGWTPIASATTNVDNGCKGAMFYRTVLPGDPAAWTFSTSVNYKHATVIEIGMAYVASAAQSDQGYPSAGTFSAPLGPVTATGPGVAIAAYVGAINGIATAVFTPGSGWAEVQQGTPFMSNASFVEWQQVAAAGSVSAAATLGAGSDESYGGVIAVFG